MWYYILRILLLLFYFHCSNSWRNAICLSSWGGGEREVFFFFSLVVFENYWKSQEKTKELKANKSVFIQVFWYRILSSSLATFSVATTFSCVIIAESHSCQVLALTSTLVFSYGWWIPLYICGSFSAIIFPSHSFLPGAVFIYIYDIPKSFFSSFSSWIMTNGGACRISEWDKRLCSPFDPWIPSQWTLTGQIFKCGCLLSLSLSS